MKKLLIITLATIALGGCGTFYSYKGKVYAVTGDGEFGQIVDESFVPLPEQKDTLLDIISRDGNQFNLRDPALADADRYNENQLLAKQVAAKGKADGKDDKTLKDEGGEDSKGD